MGSVTAIQRGKKWQYRFEIAPIDGKRQWATQSGYTTKTEAIDAGNVAYNEYKNAGSHIRESKLSMSDYLDFWMQEYCKVNLKGTTVKGYEKKIRLYIKPELGKYELKTISPAVLQKYLNDKFNEGFSRNTLASIKGILTKSFKYAVEPMQFIKQSPMYAVSLPLVNATPQTPTRHKDKEYVKPELWQEIIKRFPEGHTCHLPLMLAYHCGLRLGEIFALCWEDIDFEKKELTVNRQIQEIDKQWVFSDPKYKSFRTITIGTELLNLLKREKKKQEKAESYYSELYVKQYANEKNVLIKDAAATLNQNNTLKEMHLINVRENGTYCQPRITQHLGRVIHYQLEAPNFDLHSLRHTHCTMLLEKGADPKYVQMRLGHKNIETTLNIYSHLTDGMKSKGDSVLEKL